jgi:PEP-CTERM motif
MKTYSKLSRFSVPLMILALAAGSSRDVKADPVLFSTSGHFDLLSGTGNLVGVNNVGAASHQVGTIPLGDQPAPQAEVPFHIQFRFNDGLPPIDVTGTVNHDIYYNPDFSVLDPVVTTSATLAQRGLYPADFQDLIVHPDWLHLTSFGGWFSWGIEPLGITFSVHPEDPNEVRVVPEPSSVAVFAMAMIGLGCRLRRKRGQI